MGMTGNEFSKGPFQDVRYLIRETQALFRNQIIPKGGPDRYQAAVDRVVGHRHWEASLPLIKANLYPVLKDLDVFYVPKQLQPGPCFVFPHYDTKGDPVRAKIRPYGWDLVLNNTVAKYGLLGNNFEFKGPTWIGNSDAVIALMMRLRFLVLVEGPFDVIACRLLYPGLPVMSSGTKSLNEMHFTYLKILGVRQIHFLFDRDIPRPGADRGAGELAALGMSKAAKNLGFTTTIRLCPG